MDIHPDLRMTEADDGDAGLKQEYERECESR